MDMKRKVTKNFHGMKGKRVPMAILFTLMSGAVLFAQEENPWVGEALPESGGEFYLYNKSGGGFLLGGNSWGTQATLGQPGLACTLAVSDGKYTITTGATNGGGLGADGYVDNATLAEFEITDPTPDDGVYEYVITNGSNILYWGGDGTVVPLDANGSTTDAQWLLVSRAQRVQLLDNATADNGVDATFYIEGAGFDREQPSAWQSSYEGGTVTLCGPGTSATQYYYCAEAYNNTSFDIYQELTGLKDGRYVVSCQGFYRGDGTGTRNAMLYAGLNETPLLEGVDDGNGMPNDMTTAANAFAEGRYSGNEVSVIVTGGTLRFGIRKSVHLSADWAIFDNFRLTYYGEVSGEEALADVVPALQNLQATFEGLGATGIVAELQAIYDQYAGATDNYTEAALAISAAIETGNGVTSVTSTLSSALATAESFLSYVESGEYVLSDAVRTALDEAVSNASSVLTSSTMEEMAASAESATTTVNNAVTAAKTFSCLSHPLNAAKNLADRIGGLSGTEAYQNVAAALSSDTLAYDDMKLYVTALNAVCRDAMTSDFLGGASIDNPIDLTSFITNPNIYQEGADWEMPDGWSYELLGYREDVTVRTTGSDGTDTELYAYNWSGNQGNDVTDKHHYQKIGDEANGGISLPDGIYELRAATFANTDPDKIVLYATSDSTNFATTFFNQDETAYNTASGNMTTTTTVDGIIVADGVLYIGVRGSDWANNYQSGNGKYWLADNFRLYYVGEDAMSAYRDRLVQYLEQGAILHDSLAAYGIDDADYAQALEEYTLAMDDMTLEEIIISIEEIGEWNADADTVITHFLVINPILVNANNLSEQLENEIIFAQPTPQANFNAVLETATEATAAMSWDVFYDDGILTVAEELQAAVTELLNSVSLCYQMATARNLADQIGGLSETTAYQTVTLWLQQDELEPVDVEMAIQALQQECIDAMTPEVLARASEEEPFNMTTFIVNSTIYQDAVNESGEAIATQIDGWTCEANADGGWRTEADSGDTWLFCYSWSGNAAHNIASATDYRQVVGTQLDEDGKFALPVGAYRVEAATYITRQPEALFLYAQTNDVEISVVQDVNGADSTVYTYTEYESVDSMFNADYDVWNEAQSTFGTTTVIREIYVDKGALTIGVRGDGETVVTGNGQIWRADNFRLYYVGANRGDNIGGVITDKTVVESEYVDVYDITGMLIRKQVRRADAMKGLKKGIYIVGGKKYVVSGN